MHAHRSANVRDLEPSATLAVALLAGELRAQGRRIIDLSAGEPDFATPAVIARAGIEAIEAGHTHYTPVAGTPALRQTIARHLAARSGREVDPAGVVASNGAKQAVANLCFVLFGPGDRVLIPAPYWTSYPEMVKLARAEPVLVRCDPVNAFKATPADLDAAYEPSAKGLILNSPGNPTGAVYTRDELRTVLEWAAERRIWVISDEIYGRLCYTGPRAPGVLEQDDALLERTVLVDGASKVFAMTGWRLGFSYSEPGLARSLVALQSHTTSGPNTPAQYAAERAFSGEPDVEAAVAELVDAFRRRRDRVLALAEEHLPDKVTYIRPDGAFYLFLRVDSVDGADGSVGLCRRLLQDADVALVPGAAFGDDRYVRLSFATSDEVLEEALPRIGDALRRVQGGS